MHDACKTPNLQRTTACWYWLVLLSLLLPLVAPLAHAQELTPPAQAADEPPANEEPSTDAPPEESPGQADLDEATFVKLRASSMADLEKVATLCESAIEKGLDEDNQVYAKDLLTATLYEQAARLSRLIFDRQPVDPRWAQIRQLCLRQLRRVLDINPEHGDALLLNARLNTLPGGNREVALTNVELAIKLLENEPQQLSIAYQVRSSLQEDPEQTLADLNRAVELDARNLDAWRARGVYYMTTGALDKALDDLQKLLEENPDDLLAHQAIAQTLRQLEKYDEAIEHLDKVIEANPDSSLAYNLRARIAEEQGNLETAIENLNEAIRLQPRDLGALLTRARLRTAEAQYDLARADIDRALRLQPRLPQAILLRSLVYAGQKRFGDAIGDLQQLMRLQEIPSPELKLQIGTYLEMDQRPRKAIEVYTEVIDADDQNWMALRRRGDSYLSIGDQAAAVKDYERALQIQPEDSGLLNNLAWVLATSPDDELRDGARAVETAKKACEVTEYKQAHILSTLAASYAESGDFAKAVEWSEKAVAMDADQTQLANELESYRQNKPWRERQETPENPDAIPDVTNADAESDLPTFPSLDEKPAAGANSSDSPTPASEDGDKQP